MSAPLLRTVRFCCALCTAHILLLRACSRCADWKDFILAYHALRRIRQITNSVLAKMENLLTRMYEADAKGWAIQHRTEKLLRAMLLQVLKNVRSAGQLMEQVQFNMLVRWFAGSLVPALFPHLPRFRREAD